MINLNLSICGDLTLDTSALHQLLDEYQSSSPTLTHVNVYPIPWEAYRQELTSMIIHNHTGDVSQAGAPVASDMMAMNAIRPFNQLEVNEMGGESAFATVAWQSEPNIGETNLVDSLDG